MRSPGHTTGNPPHKHININKYGAYYVRTALCAVRYDRDTGNLGFDLCLFWEVPYTDVPANRATVVATNVL
jgi:hypothetical protein